MKPLRVVAAPHRTPFAVLNSRSSELLDQAAFLKMLHIEQKRTERSHSRFVLMLLDFTALHGPGISEGLSGVLESLSNTTRETDVTGWHKQESVFGIVFTELGAAEEKVVEDALRRKVGKALASALSAEEIQQVQVTLQIFPDDWDGEGGGRSSAALLYPGTARKPNHLSLHAKRAMDVAGSLSALILLSPVMAAIALGIKVTSPGPVLFRQKRVGQYGGKFTFLKFRSMHCGNDPAAHREFVRRLITEGAQQDQKVYKMVDDPRITPLGKFLRKTSLDELPQLWNVLRGDMSLVGPRPPIPYEVECYDLWHRRRLLAVKPGITGLWQVTGRSRVGFDEMVRLDLKYARLWSLWLDVKILLQTPRAVLSGEGAC